MRDSMRGGIENSMRAGIKHGMRDSMSDDLTGQADGQAAPDECAFGDLTPTRRRHGWQRT
jgi:hypothetical protein